MRWICKSPVLLIILVLSIFKAIYDMWLYYQYGVDNIGRGATLVVAALFRQLTLNQLIAMAVELLLGIDVEQFAH